MSEKGDRVSFEGVPRARARLDAVEQTTGLFGPNVDRTLDRCQGCRGASPAVVLLALACVAASLVAVTEAVAAELGKPYRVIAQNAAPAQAQPAPATGTGGTVPSAGKPGPAAPGGAPAAAAAGSELDRIRAAAEAGNEAAQYTLGMRLWLGDGVGRDVNKAIIWLSRAAGQDYAFADSALGMIYDDGDGVPQDYARAAYHYHRAAEKGEPLAQYRLGILYTHGRGVPQDYAEAARWYKAAAAQGWADAQNNLGYFYEFGAGVPKDLQAALAWYEKAASGGNEEAKENLAHLKAQLAAANPASPAATATPPGRAGAAVEAARPSFGAAAQGGATAPQLSAPKPPAQPGTTAAAGAGEGAAAAPKDVATAPKDVAATAKEMIAALTSHPVGSGDLPPGFSATRAESVPLGVDANRPAGEVRVDLTHAAGPHWYGYRVYATGDEAQSAYNNYATDALLAAPAGFAVRSFTVRRFEMARLRTYQCLHGHDPRRAPEDHEVTCAYLAPDAPIIVLAGAAARYPDADHPPEAVWQRLSDLLAYAFGHWQQVRKDALAH